MIRRLAGASCLVLFIPRLDALPNESMDCVEDAPASSVNAIDFPTRSTRTKESRRTRERAEAVRGPSTFVSLVCHPDTVDTVDKQP